MTPFHDDDDLRAGAFAAFMLFWTVIGWVLVLMTAHYLLTLAELRRLVT